jgi:hypothetical protein
MADQVTVSGPITVTPDSKARVAFDLMEKIATRESTEGGARSSTGEDRNKRDYWLKLYHQCWEAASGYEVG